MTADSAPRVVRGALTPGDLAVARDLIAAAEDADGVAPLSEQFVLALAASDGRHVLSPHGYAGVVVSPSGGVAVEGVVDPAHRGLGEGGALMATALAEGRRAGDGEPPLLWAHGDLPGAAGLAANLDLRRVRELLQLRRPLAADASVLPPLHERDDLVLRTYRGPSDDAEILRVNNAAFSWHPEQGGWTQAQIDERTGADWFEKAGLFLAFDRDNPDRLLGFHWTKVHPAGEKGAEALGEVYVVGVDPAAQGRGVGTVLTLAGLHHLADRGLTEVELYVEGDNTAALATYRGLGFGLHARDVAYR